MRSSVSLPTADIICIGAGISGAVLAERYANIGKKVLVLEKREHIGGNCFDYVNEAGLLISKYGAHLFHTDSAEVWTYVQKFSDWYPYQHKVLAKVGAQFVPMPVNITTVNQLFGLHIQTEAEMKKWLQTQQIPHAHPKNSQEVLESRVGPQLAAILFRDYTFKQWAKYPEELAPEVLQRIPVHSNFDDHYFADHYQFLPTNGYTKLFEKMLSHPNISLRLNTDYFQVREQLPIKHDQKIFYTGPIDQYFQLTTSIGQSLEYRSLRFEETTLNQEYFQPAAVVNYPDKEVPFTRIVEYKHFLKNQPVDLQQTTIVKEYSSAEGEPFYPVPSARNQALYEQYRHAAAKLTNIYFVGRLANYKYFNMDQAFKNALDLFYDIERVARPGSAEHQGKL